LRINANFVEAHNSLGNILKEKDRLDDVQSLQSSRGSLREMMEQSPPTGARLFTGNLENC
jgi:hypothetical protein